MYVLPTLFSCVDGLHRYSAILPSAHVVELFLFGQDSVSVAGISQSETPLLGDMLTDLGTGLEVIGGYHLLQYRICRRRSHCYLIVKGAGRTIGTFISDRETKNTVAP